MQLLEFIFSTFWTWSGTIIFLASIFGMLGFLIDKIKGASHYHSEEDEEDEDNSTEKLDVDEIIADLYRSIDKLGHSKEFYKNRVELLQDIQHIMRDPERKMVCDIIANGQVNYCDYKEVTDLDARRLNPNSVKDEK